MWRCFWNGIRNSEVYRKHDYLNKKRIITNLSPSKYYQGERARDSMASRGRSNYTAKVNKYRRPNDIDDEEEGYEILDSEDSDEKEVEKNDESEEENDSTEHLAESYSNEPEHTVNPNIL